MPTADQDSLAFELSDDRLSVRTRSYRLEISLADDDFARSPYATLGDADGKRWTKLSLLASADTREASDETFRVGPVNVEETDLGVRITVAQHSAAWSRKVVTLLCAAEAIELALHVSGTARLTDVTLAGGRAVLRGGAAGVFRSSMDFAGLFVPVPTEPIAFVRPSASAATLGVVGDADPGRLNGIFSPPPFVYGFARAHPVGPTAMPEGDWLGVSLRGAVASFGFTAFRYEPLDGGFLFRLPYEGHTRVSGDWTSPTLVFRPAASAMAVLDDHRGDLQRHGFAEAAEHPTAPDWWSEPLFCGWGAQCARLALRASREGRAVTDLATSLARADVYDEFLTLLASNGLEPGTIVIDDRWQAEYGTGTPDLDHWPDLRGWIAARHAEGRRVLLWWKAWDPQGIDPAECVIDADGNPVAVDPGNPAYLSHLATIIRGLIGTEGLDADGFKIDFTQRAPSGESIRSATDGVWGVAALHSLLSAIYSAAKEVKPDALVVTHAIHPSFGDVSDMVRLNDVLEWDNAGQRVSVVDQLRIRAAIARHSLPDHLIDTDQWPMPNRAQWLNYVDEQARLGVPALYYLEYIDNSGEELTSADLAKVARSWHDYRKAKQDAHR